MLLGRRDFVPWQDHVNVKCDPGYEDCPVDEDISELLLPTHGIVPMPES